MENNAETFREGDKLDADALFLGLFPQGFIFFDFFLGGFPTKNDEETRKFICFFLLGKLTKQVGISLVSGSFCTQGCIGMFKNLSNAKFLGILKGIPSNRDSTLFRGRSV